MPGQEAVYEILKQVYDPEVGINIVDMGLIYGVEIEGPKIDLIMTLRVLPALPAHISCNRLTTGSKRWKAWRT